MQVVRPGFRPVLPWVGSGVSADEAVLPIGRRARSIVGPQRLAVVRPLIAEDRAKVLLPAGVADQPVPVVVPRLVSQVAQQRPVRFVQFESPAYPFVVVGFRDVQGDHAVGMAGHDALPGLVCQELEHRAVAVPVGRIDRRQAETRERIEKAPLGNFDPEPSGVVARGGQVGQHLRQAAAHAQRVGVGRRNREVARLLLRAVLAQAIVARRRAVLADAAPQALSLGHLLDRIQRQAVRQESQCAGAMQAFHVFEEHRTAAVVAME